VFRLTDDCALVYTVDILTPTVSDPCVFGQIVAANCISDIYAMGGDPRLALNVVGFPNNGDPETLGAMLLGGQKKAGTRSRPRRSSTGFLWSDSSIRIRS
jgi:selenide,water dikinase